VTSGCLLAKTQLRANIDIRAYDTANTVYTVVRNMPHH